MGGDGGLRFDPHDRLRISDQLERAHQLRVVRAVGLVRLAGYSTVSQVWLPNLTAHFAPAVVLPATALSA